MSVGFVHPLLLVNHLLFLLLIILTAYALNIKTFKCGLNWTTFFSNVKNLYILLCTGFQIIVLGVYWLNWVNNQERTVNIQRNNWSVYNYIIKTYRRKKKQKVKYVHKERKSPSLCHRIWKDFFLGEVIIHVSPPVQHPRWIPQTIPTSLCNYHCPRFDACDDMAKSVAQNPLKQVKGSEEAHDGVTNLTDWCWWKLSLYGITS